MSKEQKARDDKIVNLRLQAILSQAAYHVEHGYKSMTLAAQLRKEADKLERKNNG